jgi:hypothetical protein
MQATTTTCTPRRVRRPLSAASRRATSIPLGAVTWHHTPAARDTEIEGAALRNFYLEHAPARANDDFFGQGQSYEYVLRVVTSYASVEPAHLDHMITQDGVDLWQTFEGLYDPSTPGLYACEYQGRRRRRCRHR